MAEEPDPKTNKSLMDDEPQAAGDELEEEEEEEEEYEEEAEFEGAEAATAAPTEVGGFTQEDLADFAAAVAFCSRREGTGHQRSHDRKRLVCASAVRIPQADGPASRKSASVFATLKKQATVVASETTGLEAERHALLQHQESLLARIALLRDLVRKKLGIDPDLLMPESA